jgi:hypothetical protein
LVASHSPSWIAGVHSAWIDVHPSAFESRVWLAGKEKVAAEADEAIPSATAPAAAARAAARRRGRDRRLEPIEASVVVSFLNETPFLDRALCHIWHSPIGQ